MLNRSNLKSIHTNNNHITSAATPEQREKKLAATQSKYTVNDVYHRSESKLEKPTKVRPLNRRSYKKSFFPCRFYCTVAVDAVAAVGASVVVLSLSVICHESFLIATKRNVFCVSVLINTYAHTHTYLLYIHVYTL